MTITSLKSALQRIAQLEQENEQLRAELEVYKNRNTGGRKKHDEAWMTSYRDFAVKYESGMTIMEIAAQGEAVTIPEEVLCKAIQIKGCRTEAFCSWWSKVCRGFEEVSSVTG